MYGDAQQDACIKVVAAGELNNLDPAVSPVIGCVNTGSGIVCEAVCLVFTP
jgi:hypothetical protein